MTYPEAIEPHVRPNIILYSKFIELYERVPYINVGIGVDEILNIIFSGYLYEKFNQNQIVKNFCLRTHLSDPVEKYEYTELKLNNNIR